MPAGATAILDRFNRLHCAAVGRRALSVFGEQLRLAFAKKRLAIRMIVSYRKWSPIGDAGGLTKGPLESLASTGELEMALSAIFNRYCVALLGSLLFMVPASNASAAGIETPNVQMSAAERCKGPCPANADCICGPCDTPLVLIDGKWQKTAKPGAGKSSDVCRASKKNRTS